FLVIFSYRKEAPPSHAASNINIAFFRLDDHYVFLCTGAHLGGSEHLDLHPQDAFDVSCRLRAHDEPRSCRSTDLGGRAVHRYLGGERINLGYSARGCERWHTWTGGRGCWIQ